MAEPRAWREPKRGVAAGLWGSTSLRLVLLAFIVYNVNLRSISSFDTNSTRYLPISVLTEFDLDLDEFAFLHTYPAWAHRADSEDDPDAKSRPAYCHRSHPLTA